MRGRALILVLLAITLPAAVLVPVTAARRSATAATSASPTDVLRGEHLYGQFCGSCHGANGSGVDPAMQIGAAPLRSQTVQRSAAPPLRGVGALAADFYLRTGYMPLQEAGTQPRRTRVLLEDAQIRDITAYVASLGTGPAIPAPQPARGNLAQGMQLFSDHCGGCHQIVAQGGYVTGAIPPPLKSDSAVEVAEAVRIGPYVMPRFSKQAITDRQLDSIIAYLRYTKHPDDFGGWGIGHLGPVPEGLVTWFVAAVVLVALCAVIGRRLQRES